VIIFFIISGIVISNSVFQKISRSEKYSFKYFFIDRFSRIYSALIPCLIVIWIINYIHPFINPGHYSGSLDWVTFAGNLFQLQNFPVLGIQVLGDAGILWTLNYEWWLYLFFGCIIFYIMMRRKFEISHVLLLTVCSFFPLYCLFFDFQHENLVITWFIGVLITYILLTRPLDPNKYHILLKIAGVISLFLILLRLTMIYQNTVFDITLEILLCLLILVLLLLTNTRKRINIHISHSIKFVASYSFTLYLIHYSWIIFLRSLLSNYFNPYVLVIIGVISVNLLAFAIAYFTEMRYKKLSGWLQKKFVNG